MRKTVHLGGGGAGFTCEACGITDPDKDRPSSQRTHFTQADPALYGHDACYEPCVPVAISVAPDPDWETEAIALFIMKGECNVGRKV